MVSFRFYLALNTSYPFLGLPTWLSGKESTSQCRRHRTFGFALWTGKIPWRRRRQLTPVFLPGKLHGQRSLVDYSSWGHEKSDTTEQLSAHTHTHIHMFLTPNVLSLHFASLLSSRLMYSTAYRTKILP